MLIYEKLLKERDEEIKRLKAENAGLKETIFRMAEQQVVELKPVVRGAWKRENGFHNPNYRCSNCNIVNGLGKTKYCPNCGSDMRGE